MQQPEKAQKFDSQHAQTQTLTGKLQPGSQRILLWESVVTAITEGLNRNPFLPVWELQLLLWITVGTTPFTYIRSYHSIILRLSARAC